MREEKSTVSCHVSHRATKRSLRQHSLIFAGLFPHIASSVSCPLLLRLDMCVSSGGLPLSVYWVTQLTSQICTYPSTNCCPRPKCITLLCSIFSCSPPTNTTHPSACYLVAHVTLQKIFFIMSEVIYLSNLFLKMFLSVNSHMEGYKVIIVCEII